MVDGHELRSVGERRLDLDLGDHLGHALEDVVAREDRGAVAHEVLDAAPVACPFDRGREADLIDKAIAATLDKGLRTADIKSDGTTLVGTSQMGDAIIAEAEKLAG